jgi:hypothetical protein
MDWAMESPLTGYRWEIPDPFQWRGKMISFKQITDIESIRRKIETLQTVLSDYSTKTQFGYQGANDRWYLIYSEFTPYLREILCKLVVAQIVKLLDEANKLGVDVDNEKNLLLDFLKEVMPNKDPPA